MRLAITPSEKNKGTLVLFELLQVDDVGAVIDGQSSPSREVMIHLTIMRCRNAGSVLHTHSAGATLLSEKHVVEGGLAIEGLEMLKGLEGVQTHEH